MSSLQRYARLPQRSLEVHGDALHCVDTGGDLPVLVLVHGSPISSFGFRDQIAALAPRYRVVAPDLPGFGRSAGPAQGACFGEHARRLRDFLLHPDLQLRGPLALALHDWGGPIGLGALSLAAEAGRRFELGRLMLINTGIRPDFRPSWSWPFQYRWLGSFCFERLNMVSWGLPVLMAAAWRSAALRQVYAGPLQQLGTRRSAALLEQLHGYRELVKPLRARLPLAELEVCVVWGEPEPYFGEQDIQYLAACCPRLRVERLPGAGHFPMEDASGALSTRMLSFFL